MVAGSARVFSVTIRVMPELPWMKAWPWLVASLAFFVLQATVAWWFVYLSEVCLLVAVVLFFVSLSRNRRHVP